jgi:hypothetical protein
MGTRRASACHFAQPEHPTGVLLADDQTLARRAQDRTSVLDLEQDP